MGDEIEKSDESYEPTTVEATRGRQQGLGMGAKDLERQRDPEGEPEAGPAQDDDAT